MTSEESDASLQLVPASSFSIDQLVAAYNQTRVDYLVPMPMNAARLAEYIHIYDVDLDHSQVAVEGDQILGLAMLGVRITRGCPCGQVRENPQALTKMKLIYPTIVSKNRTSTP